MSVSKAYGKVVKFRVKSPFAPCCLPLMLAALLGVGLFFNQILYPAILASIPALVILSQLYRCEDKKILNALPLPVWMRRQGGDIDMCNDAYARQVGSNDPQKVIDEQIELNQNASRPLAEKAFSSGESAQTALSSISDGDRRVLNVWEGVLGNETIGIAWDITEKDEIAKELDRHLSAHSEVLEHLSSGIAIFGADTRLSFYNHAWVNQSGLEEKWLSNKPKYAEILEELRAKRHLPEVADFPEFKRQQLHLFTSLIEPLEELVHLPDGTSLRRLIVAHPFGGLMFVQEDVSSKLELESSYNTLIAVQKETLDNLSEGVAAFGSDGRLKLHNPTFARLWKIDPKQLGGHTHIGDFMEEIKPRLRMNGNWEEFKTRMIGRILGRQADLGSLKCADDMVMSFSTVPLPDGGTLLSILDISDSVRAEEALLARNEALATADRLKNEFIANVSYQLRTPLNTLVGFAEIMDGEHFGQLNDKQKEHLSHILDAGHKLHRLIEDILDLASIEAGTLTLNIDEIDIKQMMQNLYDINQDWASARDLALILKTPKNIGKMHGDEQRLKQALYNLISNAVKFTPPGGSITLSAKRSTSKGEIVFSVADTGPGISEEDQSRIFESFEKGSGGRRDTRGAGLGLSLVRRFVELHGGTVNLKSKKESGTIITCHLPVNPEIKA